MTGIADLNKLVDLLVTNGFWACGLTLLKPIRTTISGRTGFDRQCNDVLPLAKSIGADPLELAERIARHVRQFAPFSHVEVTPPGFINIRISDEYIINAATIQTLEGDQRKKILIDFGAPNIAKALHVGHLRSLVIGESLRRILLIRGYEVVSDIHLGDWGLPMGMLILEVLGAPLDVPRSKMDFEAMYPIAVQKCKDDPARMKRAKLVTNRLQEGNEVIVGIWREICDLSLALIMPQIKRLGAHFDYLYGESDADRAIGSVLQELPHREDDGAVIVDVALPDDKKPMPPVIFRKSDGGFTYAATDLATILRRVDQGFNTILYVVDSRQSQHFEQVFRAARNFMTQELTHIGFGTVNGPDGKPYKTRDGGVPTLASMLDAAVAKASERTTDPKDAEIIGIGAIKFADLITRRESGYVFDIDRMMALEGKTGPYLQYAAVRLAALFKEADHHLGSPEKMGISPPLAESERALLVHLANFPEAIETSEAQLSPMIIADYAFGIAQRFSRFYADCQVIIWDGDKLTPESRHRLAICEITASSLNRCLWLLGIDIPSKM